MARDGGRLVACACGTGSVIDCNWKSRGACTVKRAQVARLLSGRTHRMYHIIGFVAGDRAGVFRGAVLHDRLRRLRSSARLALSASCDAKPAATISRTFPASLFVLRCSPDAWQSLCCPSQASRPWLDFSENSICSAPHYMRAQITRFFRSSRLDSAAVLCSLLLPSRIESGFFVDTPSVAVVEPMERRRAASFTGKFTVTVLAAAIVPARVIANIFIAFGAIP